MATIRDLAKKVRDDAKKNRESSENKARQERLSNATLSSNTAFTSAAKPQAELSKPAKITADVSGEAWTRATPSQTVIPEKTVTSQTKMPSGYTPSQEQELSRLSKLRQEAAVNLDADTMNELDAQMKAIRAQAGKQTFGDRVTDVLTAIGAGSMGQYANAVGFVNNAFKDPDYNRRQIARMQESLKTGVLSDGKPVTPAMRKTIQESIDRMTKEIEKWEAEDSTTNRIYRAADRLGEESAKATASAKEGLGSVGNTVVDAAVSLGQSTLDAVPALVTGGAAGMAPFVVRAFGGATQEARQKGADMDEQLLYGSAEAAKEYVTEKLFGLTLPQKMMGSAGAGGVDSIVENGIKNLTEKLAKTETGRKVLGGIATWFMSGVGEGAEEIIGSAIENAFINPNLRPWEPDTRTQQQKFEDALYDGLVGAVSGWMGGVTNLVTYDTSKLSPARTTRPGVTVDANNQNVYNETKVSPASSAQVQQTEVQAQVTQAENPGSTVLDAATTLFTQQGMKLKTAQEKAGIVQKLITGEEVSVRDINKLNPTSKESQALFTQLTGVQFPEGKVTQEQLYTLYRSAHDVAAQAETVAINSAEGRAEFPGINRVLDENGQATPVNQMSDEQILEQAKTVRETANPEADARAAQALAQMRGEIAPDGNALLSFKEFSDFIKQQNPKATREETARLYDQYLKDNQTVEFRGQRLSHQQFMDMVRDAPRGSELTEAEAEDLWQREVKRQQDANYNKEDSRNGQGQSAVYGAGLQGQSDQRSGMDAGGLYEGTGRAESESGVRGEYGTRPGAQEADVRGLREVPGELLNNDAPIRTSTAADGRTVFNEVSESAWSEDMKNQTKKFSRVGIQLRAAVDRIPIPGTNRYCDGVSHLGVESIVQSDSPFFTFEQLCDHESGHQYFFRDSVSQHTKLFDRCLEAYKSNTTREQRQQLLDSYMGKYKEVYKKADNKARSKLYADVVEEIICDAYAGMNRDGAGADQLQDVIKPIIDEWCAQRDAEMQTTEQKYSIDSLAEAVGLTFEKDGQVTVFKDAKGHAVDEVTEDHIRKAPLGAVIQSAVDANLITEEQAGQQVKFFSDLYNMMLKTQDIDLLWAVNSSIGFQPLESGPRDAATVNQKSRFAGYTKNSDPQYSTTVDFTTICVKTQAIIDSMSETMMRLGRGLTEDEIVNVVYKNTHEAGEPVPCPVCYVFSRWVGLGGLFNNMNQLQVQYANADETVLRRDIAELEDRIYDIMVERGYEIKTDKKTGKPKLNGKAREAMYKGMVRRKNELTAKQNLERLTGEKQLTAAENAELEKLKNQIEILDNWTWLRDVRLSENYEPVPPEILFNINAGKEFAEQYPESWKYRTTRGPAMGKAATPYADEHLGQILRGAGISDLNDAGLGDPKKNPFLKGKNGKLTPAAQKALQKSRAKIKAQNLLNGQRYQSTSDFRFEYALDYLLSFVEMQSLGGKVQLYTKVAESVPMFASVNGEVNCSLMPLGIGYRVNKDGSKTLVFSSVTGMNAEDAFNLSAKYDNVQPIMVGVNNEHIRLCMADDRITFIIPYHASGASEGRYVALMKVVGENVEERTDYSNYQTDHVNANATPEQKAAYDLRLRILTGNVGMLSETDRKILRGNDVLHNLYKRFYGKDADGNPSAIDQKYLSPEVRDTGELFYDPECFGVFLTKDQAEMVMPFEYWDRTSTIEQADENGQAFADYCESIGLHPRFSGWDAKGVYHADMDFSKDSGYWKMLVDRSAYNRDGTYHEQKAIDVTNFDAGFLLRDEAIKGIVQPSKVNDPGKTAKIVDKSVAEIQARTGKDDSGMEFYDTGKKYSVLVEDKDTLDFLNNQKTIKTYKTMQLVDGELYPPMASRINGKFEDASKLGEWEQATEHPELIKNGNKFKLDKGKGNGSIEAAYNPYMHSSNLVINDQFTGAYTRDNLVTVECEVPVSEVTSGYHAEYAKDSVGWHSWHTGTVAGQIRKEKGIERQVFLSRWIKPVRIVPDSEVASMYKDLLDGTDISVPDNVVTPSLRSELQKAGVKLQESGKVKYSVIANQDLSFAEQVDLVSKNRLNEVLEPGTSYQYGLTDSALYVQKEPNPMMQELGYGDYALVVTQDHIRQMLGKREDRAGNVINEHNHQLTVDQVSRIPELLRSPAAVLVAKGRPESLVFVTTETDYRGRPIIIPVKANGTNLAYDGVEGPAHVVTSMYGREDFGKFFADAVNRGELVYYKKERIDPILTNAGYQSSGLLSGIDSDTIVGQVNPIVKNPGERKYSITPEFEQWYLEGFTDQNDRDRVKQEIEDLRTKYGTIPAGENPTREVNLPRKINKKTRVHDTARTVMEAEATPEKRLANIQKAVLDGKLADVQVKNDVVSRRARARIEKNGWQTSLTNWTAKVRAGETSADLVAEGAVLLNNAGNSDLSGEQYVELLTDYSNLMHRTGQSLQAARILKTLSPEGRLYGIQKTVDQLNDSNRTKAEKKKGFDPAAWAEQNEIKLDPALVDAYRNAKTDTERDFLLGQIQQNIADQMPASLSEKLNNWRYLAMLGNFRTQIRNVLGNFFFQVPREVKETVAGGIEGALEKAGVKIDRTRSVVRDSATYKAAMKDFDSVRDVILSGGKVNEKMSYLNGIDSKRRIYKNKVLEGYRRVVNTAMDSGDAVFCKFTYADSLARFMAANHTTWDAAPETLREKGRLLAIKEAAEATYRDNNAFSEMVLSMRFKNPGSNKAKKAVNAVVEGILPFRKTPANILVRGVEYSPLGLVKTAVDTVSAAKGSRNVTGSDLVNEFAKSLTGSGLFALGYFLTKMGVLTALGPDDDDKEKEFWELQGNQSYSINLFGRSYTIDWLAPEAIPLLVGANTAEIAADDGLDLNAVTKAATRITDPMLEMSMLQGVNSLIENIANTKTVAALPSLVLNSLWSYGLQYVPTLTGQLNRSLDNTRRTTYTDATSGVPTGVQYSLGKLSQKVPGWSYNQIPYIDQWGRMEENYESKLGNAFAQFLSPAYQSIPETSDMERELQRLYDATGETGVLPSKAPKYLTVDGERRDLTAEEYVNYATLRGQTAYDMLTDLTGSAVYRKMSDKDKVKAVGEIYSYAADLAKQDLLGGETKGTTQKAVNADSYGISSAEYAALKTQTAGIESLKYKDQTDDDGNLKTIQNSRGLQTMEAVYSAYPSLTKKQYEALFEALGVGKTIRGYSKQMVQNKLNQMRKQAAQ